MTTYVLGAGASVHAGYPLCSALWSGMSTWVIDAQPVNSEFRKAIEVVATLHGPVKDIESMFTDLDLRRSAFGALTEDQRNGLRGRIRRCLRAYFLTMRGEAHLYEAFAKRISKGDAVVTFNYDVSLERKLVLAGNKFRIRNGYGFQADWDEPDSDVIVLKLHGSINWIGSLFEGAKGGSFAAAHKSLGKQPFVDNSDSLLPNYDCRGLHKSLPGGACTDGSTTLVLPTHEKRFSVSTSLGDEWISFYESLWDQASVFLQSSNRIVIIGYSMPAADRRARALLLWGANKRAEVALCCGTSNERIRVDLEDHGFWRVREIGTFEDFLGLSECTFSQ